MEIFCLADSLTQSLSKAMGVRDIVLRWGTRFAASNPGFAGDLLALLNYELSGAGDHVIADPHDGEVGEDVADVAIDDGPPADAHPGPDGAYAAALRPFYRLTASAGA